MALMGYLFQTTKATEVAKESSTKINCGTFQSKLFARQSLYRAFTHRGVIDA